MSNVDPRGGGGGMFAGRIMDAHGECAVVQDLHHRARFLVLALSLKARFHASLIDVNAFTRS